MSEALDELADLTADLKAWLEWEQCLGAVSWPREKVPRSEVLAAPQRAMAPEATPPQVARPRPAPPAPYRPAKPEPKPAPKAAATPAEPRVAPATAAAARSEWAEYAKPPALAKGAGPTGASLALIWTEGASPEAEQMLNRMLEGVLKLHRDDIAVVTLARVRDEPGNFRAALVAELDRLRPGLLLVMGTLGTRALLGGTAEPAECRMDWHVLEGDSHMWAARITHHPEHIRVRAASGDQAPRREAFEDLQAVATRLASMPQ